MTGFLRASRLLIGMGLITIASWLVAEALCRTRHRGDLSLRPDAHRME